MRGVLTWSFARTRMRLRPTSSRGIRILRFFPGNPSRSCPFSRYRAPERLRPRIELSINYAQGEMTMPHTVRLHRVLAAKPEKVYRAFIEADALAKWLPPNGFACTVHQLDAKVGGAHRMSFRNFTTGNSHSFGGEYVELVPNERLRYIDKFDDPNLPGQLQVTVTLKQVSIGTELNIVQEGLPDVIPLEACYLGWQESLRNLAKLVEPEINQAECQREAEAHRKQQCSFRRNAVTGKERDHGELPPTPASDRDRDERHADHDREQDRRIGERQREALRPSDRPNDDNSERVNETSNGQDYGPLRSEKNAMDVCGQCCEPPGVSPPSERRNDLWCEQETKHASEDQRAVHDEYHIAIFAQRSEA